MTSKLLTSKLFDQKHRTTSIITFLVRIWVGKILVSPASEVRANRAKLSICVRSLDPLRITKIKYKVMTQLHSAVRSISLFVSMFVLLSLIDVTQLNLSN